MKRATLFITKSGVKVTVGFYPRNWTFGLGFDHFSEGESGPWVAFGPFALEVTK